MRVEAQATAARIFTGLGALWVLLCCPHAFALDPSLDLSQHAHTAWTSRDGSLTGAVYAIAQTPDGYLWLGTPSGVLRFDGVRAVPLPLSSGQNGTCTLATLKGVYIFNASGFAPNLVPKAVVEMLRMPGDGTITVLATANVGGNVIANNITSTGSYTVNEDCSGTLAFIAGQHFNIYIAPSGKEFHMNQVDAGHVLAGKVTRVGSYGEQ